MSSRQPVDAACDGAAPLSSGFRRRIRLQTLLDAADGPQVRAALEDDFHHFRLAMQADALGRVQAVQASAPRHPYSLCPAAAGELQQLCGLPLPGRAQALVAQADARQHCTHLLDLAGLAAATMQQRLDARQYDIWVPTRMAGHTEAKLWRDGQPLLRWAVQDDTLTGPAPYIGVGLRQGLARWAAQNLGADEAEAALVLRRCVMISLGRSKPLDEQVHAAPTGLCFAQQPQRATLALRQRGSTWDFSHRPQALCADDEAWLAFAAD
ncbi:MAG: hypothetical protein CFE45_12225 [Burkholderiales bacterium PBB5]|nr:MAG: hypothetical protein CFE45_12225 [Burkholderiales bacterium PBB5]